MAKPPNILSFMMTGTSNLIYVVPDNITAIFYDTTVPGVTYLTVLIGATSTQYGVAANATSLVAKLGADSMVQVSQFGQPANILYWLPLKRITGVYLAIDDPNFTPGSIGATRIVTDHSGTWIDVSDSVATITDTLGKITAITYP